jgi:hypothetical protein
MSQHNTTPVKLLKAVQNKIDKALALIEMAKEYDVDTPSTYDGSTMESYIDITDIRVKGKYVYIEEAEHGIHAYGFAKRYNTNKVGDWDADGLADCKYHLNLICRTYRKAIKANFKARNYYPTNVTL